MPQGAAVGAAHEDDLPLLRQEGNPRSHDFNSATLGQDFDVPVRSIHADPLPILDQPGGMLHAHDGR
jgi:hypothetical protein